MSCHGKISHQPDLRLRTASPSHTIGDNSDSAPLPPPASAKPRILVLLLSLCVANPASNCLKRTYVERHSLMPPQFSVTTDRLAKTFSNVLLSWTSVPRVILSYRSVSSHVSSVPKGSLITATIRTPSVCHQYAISMQSVIARAHHVLARVIVNLDHGDHEAASALPQRD